MSLLSLAMSERTVGASRLKRGCEEANQEVRRKVKMVVNLILVVDGNIL